MRFYLILFLVFALPSLPAFSEIENLPLNPPFSKLQDSLRSQRKVNFIKEFNILTFALGMYYLDAKERLSKEEVKKKLAWDSAIWDKEFDIAFDMDNIDFKRKGFTRYYPFNIEGRDFIIRIFDVRDKGYLPEFEVFNEGVFEDSKTGFQVIPGINTIIKNRKIKKVLLPSPASYSTAP